MKRKLFTRALVPLAAVAVTVGAAGTAAASQLCSNDPTTPLPSPVFITGSSAVGNFLQGIGAALAGTTTLVYASPGSCQGVDAVFNGTKMGTGTATYWNSAGVAQTCTLANETADVGVSDVFYTSCTAPYIFTALPTGVTESLGPNQVMNFVVPFSSTQSIISAQAAYLIYGFGAAKNAVMPWNDPTVIFQRGAASGTQSMLAQAIRVPADKWLPNPSGGLPNVVAGGSTGMFNAVVGAGKTNPNTAIGILASDVTDKSVTTVSDGGTTTVSNRTQIKILAYQHTGQECAWLPDSSSTAFDKRNVRAGHYVPWGPIHFFTSSTKQAAKDLVGYFAGTTTPPTGVKLLDLEIKGHTVPQCAMQVQRSAEIGPMTAYKPAAGTACGCYMEELLAPGTSGCTACSGTTGCSATQTCSNGYCEAN